MCNITAHKINTNQNHNDISLPTHWDGQNKKCQITTRIDKDVEKQASHTQERKMAQPLWKTVRVLNIK